MKKVTQLIRVYKKKAQFKLILNLKESKVQRHMDKVSSMVFEKMDPRYLFMDYNS
jgi:hypothetical protein